MNRISLSFAEKDDAGKIIGQKELPLTFAILGDFSPQKAPANGQSVAESIVITRKNFPLIFKQLAPSVEFEVDNLITKNDSFIVRLAFTSMADFHPKSYLKRIQLLAQYHSFIARLRKAQGIMKVAIADFFVDTDLPFLQGIAEDENLSKDDSLHAAHMIRFLAVAQDIYNKQMNLIMYTAELQRLEYTWLGLEKLLEHADSFSHTKILLLHAHQDAVCDDIINRSNVVESDLFYQIYTKELDQFGGEPVSMLLNTFEFGLEDVDILHTLGRIGQLASCPVISGINTTFFGLTDASVLENDFDFTAYRREEAFRRFYALSKEKYARFLGFLLHKTCLRSPYQPDEIASEHVAYYDQPPVDVKMAGLWGTPVFVFPVCFMKFYQDNGHCSSLEGLHSDFTLSAFALENNKLLDWVPTTKTQKQLADFGVMTFRYLDVAGAHVGLDSMAMFNVNALDDISSVDLVTSERINVYLPQLLFIAQLHHYMRLIQRQSFARSDYKELKKELLDWLKQYVSDAYTASNLMKLQKPLKSVDLQVRPNEGSGIRDRLSFSLSITPHSPYRGLEYSVSL